MRWRGHLLTVRITPDFVNNQADPEAVAKLTVQRVFADRWKAIDPSATITVVPTIEEALRSVTELGAGLEDGQTVQAFITGSLHLVGGALEIIEGADAL